MSDLKQLIKRLEAFDAEWFVPSHEEPIRKSEFLDKMQYIAEIGEILGDTDELSEGKEILSKNRGRELTPDEIYYTERFVTGNRYSFVYTRYIPPAEEPPIL